MLLWIPRSDSKGFLDSSSSFFKRVTCNYLEINTYIQTHTHATVGW